MTDLFEQLITVIRREEEVLEKFLDCLNRQKEHIVQNQVELFDDTVKEEETLISTIREMEQTRMSLVKSIANATGNAVDELTLTRLIEINLGEASEEMKSLKRTLATLVDRIKKANRVNQYLIRRSLSFIQKNIDWFIDAGNLNVIYNSDGSQQVKDPGNLLVNRVL
jgi:flagellar biosynthesis/type III secretory pathway chaperone